jgi:tryptophanyl-tRNA synthetase
MEPLYPPRIISGIQPSQTIHLGHYFGALKQHVDLQHEYPGAAFFLIADYHSLTRNSNRHWLQEATLQLASAYLALGLDINKAYLYRQSDVPATLELYWILSCHSPVRDLLQSPTFKAPESKEL